MELAAVLQSLGGDQTSASIRLDPSTAIGTEPDG